MSEKPGKRLVSKAEYAGMLYKKGANYSLGLACLCIGLLASALGIGFFCVSVISMRDSPIFSDYLVFGGGMTIFGGVMIWAARYLFQQGSKIEMGAPITRHNTGQLPAVETLVRPSDLPPSHQQAELLRGAMPGQEETSAEELLRASATRGTGDLET